MIHLALTIASFLFLLWFAVQVVGFVLGFYIARMDARQQEENRRREQQEKTDDVTRADIAAWYAVQNEDDK